MRHILCKCPGPLSATLYVCISAESISGRFLLPVFAPYTYSKRSCGALIIALPLVLTATPPAEKLFFQRLSRVPSGAIALVKRVEFGLALRFLPRVCFSCSAELRPSYVIGSLAFAASSRLTPRVIVRRIMWHICSELLIEVFLRREETWLQEQCLLSPLSQRRFWRSWQLRSVSLCGCALCTCVSPPRMFSPLLSTCPWQSKCSGGVLKKRKKKKRNLLSFMCLGRRKKRTSRRRRV